MKQQFKIPTIFALFLIATIIGSATFITQSVRKATNAAPETQPKSVQVTNLTDTGFTISFETDLETTSAVTTTDPDGKKLTHFDERHSLGTVQKFTTHHIPIRGLEPEKTYSISILLAGKTYTVNELKSISTAPRLSEDTNGMPPIYGTVQTQENTPAFGALIYLSLGNSSQTLSTIVKPSGSWIIPMNVIRNQALSQLITRTNLDDKVDIKVLYRGQTTTITTDLKTSTPVPTIIVGQSRDFTQELVKKKSTVTSPTPLASGISGVLGTQKTAQASNKVSLLTPKDASVVLIDPPQFTGLGVPGNIVTLLIGAKNPKTATTKVSSDGTWKYAPAGIIGIGKQKVTMTSLDDKQKPVSITHEFEVMKSGVQVLGDATPSGIPTLFPTVFLEPTVAASSTPLPTPPASITNNATTLPTNFFVLAGIILLFGGLVVLAI